MREIDIRHINKVYGEVQALQDISLHIGEGELFGLIGPDGAGKTSLFRILTTLLLADSGTASVCGLDVVRDYKEIRWRVGYMPGRFSLYQDLTVEENLNFFATVFNTTVRENYDLIRDIYVQIEPFKKRKAGKLSGGMKQKLALSCALIHRPDVLFLDEPTTGVDPVSGYVGPVEEARDHDYGFDALYGRGFPLRPYRVDAWRTMLVGRYAGRHPQYVR